MPGGSDSLASVQGEYQNPFHYTACTRNNACNFTDPACCGTYRLVMIIIDLSETTQKKCTGNQRQYPRQNSVRDKIQDKFFF